MSSDTEVIPYNDPLMAHVADVSGWADDTPGFERRGIRITFRNGLTLSAVQGKYIYNDNDSWEIAVIENFNTDGIPGLMHIAGWGDTVCGYQTMSDIRAFAWRIALEGRKLTGE